MPVIDVYASEGTFADKHVLARNLAQAVMRWEQVPEIPLFSDNTAAFIHDLPTDAIANESGCVVGEERDLRHLLSTRLNSSHGYISYAVFCLKKKKLTRTTTTPSA